MRLIEGQFWVGLGFFAALLVFLILTFVKAKNLSEDQRGILRLISGFSAAFAGILIAGDVLVKMEGTVTSGTKFLVSGSAGFAMFLIVWFFYPKVSRLPDGIRYSVPEGWTFEHAAGVLAQLDEHTVEFEGFSETELQTSLKAWKLKAVDVAEAISQLRVITKGRGSVRKYTVDSSGSTYVLSVLA